MCKHVKKMSIIIPPRQKPSKLNRTSCDCPSTIFLTKYNKFDHSMNIMTEKLSSGHDSIFIYNTKSFTLLAHEIKTLYFDTIIKTLLPAMCILYGEPYLYKRGLSYKIQTLETNDSFLNIDIFNHTNNSIYVSENALSIICNVVIPGHRF